MHQHGVAGRVSMAVVDGLEMVGVEQQQHDGARQVAAALQFAIKPLEKSTAVGDAGQVIAIHGLAVLFAGLALVADIAHHEAIGRFRLILHGQRRPWRRRVPLRQRRDHGAAPEARAVGLHAPAFVQAPAVGVRFAQAVRQPFGAGGARHIEQRIRLLQRGTGAKARHAADAVVPFVDAAAPVQADQGIVADAGQDGIEPGIALAQLAVAPHLLGNIGQHRHQPRGIELEQAQRQKLRRWPGRIGMQLDPHAIADHAVRGRESRSLVAQVRRDGFERAEQVVQRAVARQRHQELGRDRIDQSDAPVGIGLHQADRRHVQELQQRFMAAGRFFAGRLRDTHGLRCTST